MANEVSDHVMDAQRTDREGGNGLGKGCLIAAFIAVALIAFVLGYGIGVASEKAECNEDMSIRVKQIKGYYEKQIKELESQKNSNPTR